MSQNRKDFKNNWSPMPSSKQVEENTGHYPVIRAQGKSINRPNKYSPTNLTAQTNSTTDPTDVIRPSSPLTQQLNKPNSPTDVPNKHNSSNKLYFNSPTGPEVNRPKSEKSNRPKSEKSNRPNKRN